MGKWRVVFVWFVISGIVCVSMIGFAADQQTGASGDPVAQYYWRQIENRWNASDSILGSRVWQADALVVYEQLGDSGRVVRCDTGHVVLFSTGRRVDSVLPAPGSQPLSRKPEVSWFDPFAYPFLLSFYPNDTGDALLEIGLDSDEAHPELPVGLLSFDRRFYLPRTLILSLAEQPGYRRHSRGMRYIDLNGILLADSVWEAGVLNGILSSESFRISVSFTDFRL